MTKAQVLTLGYISVVPILARDPPRLAPADNGEKCRDLRQTDECSEDKRILIAHVRNPGRDAIIHGKAHCIADEDDSDHGLAAEILVTVDAV